MELVKVDDSKKEVTFKNLDKPDDLINKKVFKLFILIMFNHNYLICINSQVSNHK